MWNCAKKCLFVFEGKKRRAIHVTFCFRRPDVLPTFSKWPRPQSACSWMHSPAAVFLKTWSRLPYLPPFPLPPLWAVAHLFKMYDTSFYKLPCRAPLQRLTVNPPQGSQDYPVSQNTLQLTCLAPFTLQTRAPHKLYNRPPFLPPSSPPLLLVICMYLCICICICTYVCMYVCAWRVLQCTASVTKLLCSMQRNVFRPHCSKVGRIPKGWGGGEWMNAPVW